MRYLILLLIPFIPISCLAQKRLVPYEYQLSSGSDIYSLIETEGITVYAESFEARRGLMIFDLEIKNHSGSHLQVDPERIYFYGSNSQLPDTENDNWEDEFIDQSTDFYPVFARSQREVERYYEKKISSKEGTKALLTILAASLIIYDAVQDGHDYRSEPTRRSVNNSMARDVAVTTSVMAVDIADDAITESQIKTDEDLYYLAEEYLPRFTLDDGRAIRGKIFFTPPTKHQFYRLMVPVSDFVLVFDFRWPTSYEKRVIK